MQLARFPALPADRTHDPESVFEAFSRTVRTRPGTPAARCGDQSLTYGELDNWARAIAARLLACGVRAGSVVAVVPQRDLGTLAALRAVWLAGAAWLLAEPGTLPAQWRRSQVSAVVIAVEADLAGLDLGPLPVVIASDVSRPAAALPLIPGTTPRLADDACILPGGAVLSHGALAGALASMRAGLHALGAEQTRGPSWLSADSLASGVALGDLLLPLTCGGRVVLTSAPLPDSIVEIAELAGSGELSHLRCAPAVAARLLAGGLDSSVTLLVGEDPCAKLGLDQARVIRLIEVDDLVGWVALDGTPARDLEVRVVDARLRPLPAGVPGELCVGGACLADRLHADPAGTAERFVPDPLGPAGARLCRTGRLARLTSDGRLEQLGPLSREVSDGRLTGLYRTREALGRWHPVLDSLVLLRPDAPAGLQLIGYLRTAAGTALDEDELRRALARDRLPQQLVPDVLIGVDEWPLDERGTVDADRLPEPGEPAEAPDPSEASEAAQAPWDERFASLLRGALDRVGFQGEPAPDEPLASSGLDSFGTVGLLLALETAYRVTIPDNLQITEVVRTPRTLWQTIAALAQELSR